jgi:hypothetical protein
MSQPTLAATLLQDGAAIYYTDSFRVMIEFNLQWLLSSTYISTFSISNQSAYVYEYDLFGLLTSMSVPRQLHWIVMRLNGLNSPDEFRADMSTLYLPNESVIENMVNLENTVSKIM